MGGEGTQPPLMSQERPANDRLDSWKEIAAYLKKEVRTVQRLEKSLGLPVRRLAHGKQGSVFAYKSDLDAWWQESQTKIPHDEDEEQEDKADGAYSRQSVAVATATSEQAEKGRPEKTSIVDRP